MQLARCSLMLTLFEKSEISQLTNIYEVTNMLKILNSLCTFTAAAIACSFREGISSLKVSPPLPIHK